MALEPIWQPPSAAEEPTRLTRFRKTIAAKHGVDLPTYFHFWQWSVLHPDLFWEAIWDECGIIGDKGSNFSANVKAGDDLYPPPLWFPGSKLNYAENLLRFCEQGGSEPAVIAAFEPKATGGDDLDFQTSVLSRTDLRRQVAAAAAAFRQQGVRPGDIIGAYSANNAAALVAFLACSAVGAIWCSVAAEAAPEAVLDRFETVRPRWIVSVDSVRYNGKRWAHLDKLKQVLTRLDTSKGSDQQAVEGVIIAPGPEPASESELATFIDATRSPSLQVSSWNDFLKQCSHASEQPIPYERLDFNAPLWILFSSGTTGKPKAIVHRAGGMLLQLAKEHLLHSGLDSSDVVCQYSTLSWMMSPWSNAVLMSGATLVLYDGSPLKPTDLVMFELSAQLGVTVFGTSAAFLDIISKKGVEPKEAMGSRLKLKQILSTGSPLRADLYPWIKEHIGNVLIGSITGGTDICSLFAGNNVDLPVHAGEIQCPNLGMHVGIISTLTGKPLQIPTLAAASHGQDSNNEEEGELVCLAPFPAQPLGFWNQPEEKYRSSYYETFGPKIWAHGDWVSWTKNGGLVMKGRSDGVLNPGGVRFGSAEIYEVLATLASSQQAGTQPDYSLISASLAISLRTPDKSDEVVVLALVMRSDPAEAEWNALVEGIKKEIRSRRSARHVPRFVVRVQDVPVTVNGKLAEVPAKKREWRESEWIKSEPADITTSSTATVLNGTPISTINASTLANAGCLEEYVKLGNELRAQLQ